MRPARGQLAGSARGARACSAHDFSNRRLRRRPSGNLTTTCELSALLSGSEGNVAPFATRASLRAAAAASSFSICFSMASASSRSNRARRAASAARASSAASRAWQTQQQRSRVPRINYNNGRPAPVTCGNSTQVCHVSPHRRRSRRRARRIISDLVARAHAGSLTRKEIRRALILWPYLGRISSVSRAYIGRISIVSRPYLNRISSVSRPYLGHISLRMALDYHAHDVLSATWKLADDLMIKFADG